MSHRVRCRSCRTAFLVDDDRRAACPKCGARVAPSLPPTADNPVFVPADPDRPRRRGRRAAIAAVAFLTVAGVAGIVAWPALTRWWHPVPPDPVESVATAYLQALVEGDGAAAEQLGTVEIPPGIRSYREVRRDKTRNHRVKGSFAPVTAFHGRINASYTFDPEAGRFVPKNALGPAAETLDALHDAKTKAEAEKTAEKIKSGNPDDVFDAAEALAKSMAALSEGALSPQKLIPTYKQLIDDAKPPLPPTERELALHVADNRETWDRLLKRPFLTLKSDDPYIFDRTEVTALVVDALGSSGAAPTPMRLTLTRFHLGRIDTKWRVTAARRENVPDPARPLPPPEPPPSKASKYESNAAPK